MKRAIDAARHVAVCTRSTAARSAQIATSSYHPQVAIAARADWIITLGGIVCIFATLAATAAAEQLPLAREVGRGGRGVRAQVPQIPATFYGAATIDGRAPPEGSEVRGIINGLDCTQPGAAGTITAEGVGAYVISVMHESQKPGCGQEGVAVSFTIAGRSAGQSAIWSPGPQTLGLNAGAGQVQPLPASVPVPTQAAPTGTTAPGGLPPTDAIHLPGDKTTTPLPPGTSGSADSDDEGPGVAGLAIVALFVIALLAGAAGMAISRRKPAAGPPRDGGAGGSGERFD